MTSPPTPDTPASWDAASRGYAEQIAPRMMRSFAESLVNRLDLADDCEAVEVAAGSGALTEALFPRVRSLLATDFAPKMIEILRERLQVVGATNVRCEVMDGQALALEDDRFDAAACSFALMLFPDRAKGFAELHRVLRPGGRAVVSAWAEPAKFEALGLFVKAVQTAFPDLPKPEAPPPVFSLANPDVFRSEMTAAGFREVDVEFEARELRVDEFDQLWSMLTVGAPPAQMLLDRVGRDGEARLRETLAAIVEARFGSDAIVLTNTATIGSGIAS